MKPTKYLVPFLALFVVGCGVGTGVTTSSTYTNDDYDLFTTLPKNFTEPQQVTWTSPVIEKDSTYYELSEFNMTLQENPADPNSIKLTIDVVTPDKKQQRMTVYTNKDE